MTSDTVIDLLKRQKIDQLPVSTHSCALINLNRMGCKAFLQIEHDLTPCLYQSSMFPSGWLTFVTILPGIERNVLKKWIECGKCMYDVLIN